MSNRSYPHCSRCHKRIWFRVHYVVSRYPNNLTLFFHRRCLPKGFAGTIVAEKPEPGEGE